MKFWGRVSDATSTEKRKHGKNEFRSMEPKNEQHNRIGKWLARVVLGVTLAAGGASISCGSHQEQEKTTITAGQTDGDGNAAINSDGWDFNFHALDSASMDPVPNVGVLLFANGARGDYLALDPTNTYFPAFGIADGIQIDKSSSKFSPRVFSPDDQVYTNVLLDEPAASLCGITIGGNLYSGFADFLLSDNMTKGLFEAKKSSVKLSDLDSTMTQFFGLSGGYVGGEAAKKGIVALLPKAGVTKAGIEAVTGEIDAVGWAALALTLCADVSNQAYARYYQRLCYDENATFTVYGLNGIQQISDVLNNIPVVNLLAGFDSPFYIIRPDSPSNVTTPPFVEFNLNTYGPTNNVNQPWNAINAAYSIDDDTNLPFLAESGSGCGDIGGPGACSIELNTCGSVKPAKITSVNGGYELATSSPITITATDDYSVTFYLQKPDTFSVTCPGGYQTYYKSGPVTTNVRGGAHYDVAVACEQPDGYLLAGGSCKNTPSSAANDGGAAQAADPSCSQQAVDGGVAGGIDASSMDAGAGALDADPQAIDATNNYSYWYRTYPSLQDIYSVKQSQDGGYILAGDKAIIKTDALGNVVWSYSTQANDVLETNDGCFVAEGSTNMVKLNQNGNLIWNNQYNDGAYASIAELPDGSYMVAGFDANSSFLRKVSQNGEEILKQELMFQSVTGLLAIDDGIVVSGVGSEVKGGTPLPFLLKTDFSGNTLWTKSDLNLVSGWMQNYVINGETDPLISMAKLSDGGFAAVFVDSDGTDLYNFSSNGDVRWGIPKAGDCSYLNVIKEGNLVCVANGISMYNPNGTLIWDKKGLGDVGSGVNFLSPKSIQETTDGGFIIAGLVQYSGPYNGILIKMTPK